MKNLMTIEEAMKKRCPMNIDGDNTCCIADGCTWFRMHEEAEMGYCSQSYIQLTEKNKSLVENFLSYE